MVLLISVIIPLLCLLLVFGLFVYMVNYSNSIKKTCNEVQKFADDLEDSLTEIGTFNRQEEGMIVRGELVCPHINEGKRADPIARKLDWYAHTRYYYFSGEEDTGDSVKGSTEDWFRRQIKFKLGE